MTRKCDPIAARGRKYEPDGSQADDNDPRNGKQPRTDDADDPNPRIAAYDRYQQTNIIIKRT